MRVPVPGAELHYDLNGRGPTCLVLSAIGTEPYRRMTPPPLSDRLRLVYVDLRGGGRSTGEPADLTFDVLATDLEAIRTDLGVDRCAVLGHSILGALAIEYGRRFPESVSHVIAVGTPPSGDMAGLSKESATFFEQHASEERKRILRENLARLPADAAPGQALFARTPMRFCDPRFDPSPLFAGVIVKPGLLQHILGTLAPGWDIRVDPETLRVPVLIAHGRHDYTVPHVRWPGIVERLPRATMKLFEHSGHQPFFEEPEEFARTVRQWMSASR